jgi:hypothetical protein
MLGYHAGDSRGRRINDGMGKIHCRAKVKQMIQAGFSIKGAHIIVSTSRSKS